MDRPTFPALVADYEHETGTTVAGTPFVTFRQATVTTEFETIQRTVMAFGSAAARVSSVLRDAGDVAVELELYQAGPILKVAGSDDRQAA